MGKPTIKLFQSLQKSAATLGMGEMGSLHFQNMSSKSDT